MQNIIDLRDRSSTPDEGTRLSVRNTEWGQLVRQMRERRGMNLEQLSGLIDVDLSTLARYERGELACEYEKVCLIADALAAPGIETLAQEIIVRRFRRPPRWAA